MRHLKKVWFSIGPQDVDLPRPLSPKPAMHDRGFQLFFRPMTDHDADPNTEKRPAAISAAAGIGRCCPFCGRREKNRQDWCFFRDPGTHATAVECKNCGARGPLCIPSEERALTAW